MDYSLKRNANFRGTGHLNKDWHQLKTALLDAARAAFLKRVISLTQPQATPYELRPFIHLSHKLDHFISSFFKILMISNLYTSWNRFYPSFHKEFLEYSLIKLISLKAFLYLHHCILYTCLRT